MSRIISAELEKKILARLQSFVWDSSPDPVGLRKIAAQINALPICSDMGGALAIRPDGEIVMFYWEDPTNLKVVDDPRIRNTALFQGSKKYPELKALVPLKPPDALECPYCKGTGIDPATSAFGVENIVCYCGGLGWLLEERLHLEEKLDDEWPFPERWRSLLHKNRS